MCVEGGVMGVYVRGMVMPETCACCDFLSGESIPYGDYVCECKEMSVDNEIVMEGIPDWCPLVEVPTPHGDLVDRDKVYQSFYTDNPQINDAVLYAQTVIPAEGV
jgi:hypothetical protein